MASVLEPITVREGRSRRSSSPSSVYHADHRSVARAMAVLATSGGAGFRLAGPHKVACLSSLARSGIPACYSPAVRLSYLGTHLTDDTSSRSGLIIIVPCPADLTRHTAGGTLRYAVCGSSGQGSHQMVNGGSPDQKMLRRHQSKRFGPRPPPAAPERKRRCAALLCLGREYWLMSYSFPSSIIREGGGLVALYEEEGGEQESLLLADTFWHCLVWHGGGDS